MNTAGRVDIKLVQKRYHALNELIPLHSISSEQEYEHMVHILDEMLDAGGAVENSELADLVDIVSELISQYEYGHDKSKTLTGIEMLKFLMAQHGLSQADLPEIGSQGVVSEVLNGKRTLNKAHIAKLADRFGVSPAVFF